ncbi:MAG: hypothetical protein H7338_21430 [Candidatus Sericytochromatia bacterium]|nr:hypothetical protein [Candidatus Sericytochromatia bacterium]
MARRPEPKHKTPAEVLADLQAGYQEASFMGPAEAQRYLTKVLTAQHSLPNAVKFFAYDMLAEASYENGDTTACLEAVEGAQKYLPAAQEDAARAFADYLPQARFYERGISALSDTDEIAQAMALCDKAIAMGLGRAYEAKRHSLERRL